MGFVFAGSTGFGFLDVQWTDHFIDAGAVYNLGTTEFDGVSINNHINGLGGTSFFVDGMAGSGNIANDGIGTITLGKFQGTGTPLNNITSMDAKWDMQLNEVIADTRPDVLLTLRGNSTETVIATINTPVKAAGTWVVQRSSQFSADTSGTSEYDSAKPSGGLPITMVGIVRVATGSNDDVTAYLAINGTIVAASGAPVDVPSATPGVAFASIIWQEELIDGDTLELFLENNTDTTNIILEDATIRIN
jgi:hypothetical protein